MGQFGPLEILAQKPALLYRAIELPGKPALYANLEQTEENESAWPLQGHSVAYQFVDAQTGGRLLVAPDVGEVTDELREALHTSDAILFDGTFWSADELARIKDTARSVKEMGHVTIKDCSLELLRQLPARHKIYLHINNTNPILLPGSPERALVEAAGVMVGVDGFEFEI